MRGGGWVVVVAIKREIGKNRRRREDIFLLAPSFSSSSSSSHPLPPQVTTTTMSRTNDGKGREPASALMTILIDPKNVDMDHARFQEGFIPVNTDEGVVTHFVLPVKRADFVERYYDILGPIVAQGQSGSAPGNPKNFETSLNLLGSNPIYNTSRFDMMANQIAYMIHPCMLFHGLSLTDDREYEKQVELVKGLYAKESAGKFDIIQTDNYGNKMYPLLTLPYDELPTPLSYAYLVLGNYVALSKATTPIKTDEFYDSQSQYIPKTTSSTKVLYAIEKEKRDALSDLIGDPVANIKKLHPASDALGKIIGGFTAFMDGAKKFRWGQDCPSSKMMSIKFVFM
jgi:hypothetical protein